MWENERAQFFHTIYYCSECSSAAYTRDFTADDNSFALLLTILLGK